MTVSLIRGFPRCRCAAELVNLNQWEMAVRSCAAATLLCRTRLWRWHEDPTGTKSTHPPTLEYMYITYRHDCTLFLWLLLTAQCWHILLPVTLSKAANKKVIYWLGQLFLLHLITHAKGLVHFYICSCNVQRSQECNATTSTTRFTVTMATAWELSEGSEVKGWVLFSGEIKSALCLDSSSEDGCPAGEESAECVPLLVRASLTLKVGCSHPLWPSPYLTDPETGGL